MVPCLLELSFLLIVVKMTVKITNVHALTGMSRKLRAAGMRAVKRIADVTMNAAIADYASKRQTDNQVSFILDSFNYSLKRGGAEVMTAVVFCGGPKAPYAIYVDQPRQSFKGYFFMDAGAKAGNDAAPMIINEELVKVKGLKI